jgi:hypothetical protein
MNMKTHWHLRLTIEASAKERIEEIAKTEHRSPSGLASMLFEQYQRERQETVRDSD